MEKAPSPFALIALLRHEYPTLLSVSDLFGRTAPSRLPIQARLSLAGRSASDYVVRMRLTLCLAFPISLLFLDCNSVLTFYFHPS